MTVGQNGNTNTGALVAFVIIVHVCMHMLLVSYRMGCSRWIFKKGALIDSVYVCSSSI